MTLYTRTECGLCDEVMAELERLAARYPLRLSIVDIGQDAELEDRFGEVIPVVDVAGTLLYAPIDPWTLRSEISRARKRWLKTG